MGWFPGNNSFDLAEGSLIVFSMELGSQVIATIIRNIFTNVSNDAIT